MTTRGKTHPRCDELASSAELFLASETCSDEIAPLSRTRVQVGRLYNLVVVQQDDVLLRAREKAAARSRLQQRERTIGSSVTLFARHLRVLLAAPAFHSEQLRQVAEELGSSWLSNGLDPSELVRSYGDVCQAVSRREAAQLKQLGSELAKLLDSALQALATLQSCGAPLQAPAEALLDLTLCLLQQRIDRALQGVPGDAGQRSLRA